MDENEAIELALEIHRYQGTGNVGFSYYGENDFGVKFRAEQTGECEVRSREEWEAFEVAAARVAEIQRKFDQRLGPGGVGATNLRGGR